MKSLDKLSIGQGAYIIKINAHDKTKSRLLDLGFIKNSYVKCIYQSPFKSPRAYLIGESVIALRNSDASLIIVGDSNEI